MPPGERGEGRGETKATLDAYVKLPALPNFVRVDGLGIDGSVDVAKLTDSMLRRLGKRWTEALIQHAQKRRASNA